MAIRPTRHFMVDLETLAVDPRAAPWQIAIVEFVMHADGKCVSVGNDYVSLLNPDVIALFVENNEMVESEDTIKWLHGQPAIAQTFTHWYDVFKGSETKHDWMMYTATSADLEQAFVRLGIDSNSQMWAKGVDFDFPILSNLLRQYGIKEPWHYRNKNCMRSWINEAARWGVEVPKPSATHDAFQDCVEQIELLSYVRSGIIDAIRR